FVSRPSSGEGLDPDCWRCRRYQRSAGTQFSAPRLLAATSTAARPEHAGSGAIEHGSGTGCQTVAAGGAAVGPGTGDCGLAANDADCRCCGFEPALRVISGWTVRGAGAAAGDDWDLRRNFVFRESTYA